MKPVCEKILRYVVPFSYSIPFDEAISLVENGKDSIISFKKEIACNGQETESDIYEYLRNEFKFSLNDNRKKMGCTFKADIDKNTPILELIPESLLFSSDSITNQDIIILDEIGLILGRNGIGFLWYEICTKNSSKQSLAVDELIEFQYQFKELCRSNQSNLLWNRVRITENNQTNITVPQLGIKEEKIINGDVVQTCYYVPFSMGNWLAEILSFLDVHFTPEKKNPIDSIYTNVKKRDIGIINRNNMNYQFISNDIDDAFKKNVPDKALLFSYCCLEKQENPVVDEAVIQNLVYLTNGYKESYSICSNIDENIFMPFSNVAWYTSQEGCACIALPTEKGMEFMSSTLLSKIKVDYFMLYLKCLYQSYSLLRYAERIQNELSADKMDYINTDEEKTVENLISSISLFLTKSMATSVSHINHQSDFYIYIKEKLHIHEDVESVTAGLEALSNIETENIQLRESEKSDRIQAVMGLFSVLAIGSALLDTYDLLEKFIPKWDLSGVIMKNPIYITIYVIVFVFMITVSVTAATYAFKAIRATGKQQKKNKGKKKNNK